MLPLLVCMAPHLRSSACVKPLVCHKDCLFGLMDQGRGLDVLVTAAVEVSPKDSFEATGQGFPNSPAVSHLMSKAEQFEQSLTFGAK